MTDKHLQIIFQFVGIALIASQIAVMAGAVIFLASLISQNLQTLTEKKKLEKQEAFEKELKTIKAEVNNLAVAAGFRGMQ